MKAVKIFLLVLLGLLLLVGAAYIPALQRFALGRVEQIVAQKTGMTISVDDFRLRFPLRVELRGARVMMPEGDTLATVAEGRLKVLLLPLLRSKVRVDDFGLRDARVAWRDSISGLSIRARIDGLVATSATINPNNQTISLAHALLDGCDVAVVLGKESGGETPPADTVPLDWRIELGRLDVQRLGLAVDMPGADSVTTPFNYARVRAREAGVTVRDFTMAGSDISASFENLQMAEQSGLTLIDGRGRLAMGAERFRVEDLVLQTTGSSVTGSASMGLGDERIPFKADLEARLAGDEIALAAPLPAEAMRVLAGRIIAVKAQAGGSMEDVTVDRYEVEMADNLHIAGYARVQNPINPALLRGNVAMTAVLKNLDFARAFIPDADLRRRVAIPRNMTLTALADFTMQSAYLKQLKLLVPNGALTARGRFDLPRQGYDGELRLTDFPLHRFMPRDSLGLATASIKASGRGFDPATLSATAELEIERLDYGTMNFGRATAEIEAAKGDVKGTIISRSALLISDISFDGRITKDSYELNARIDSTTVDVGGEKYKIDRANLTAAASPTGTRAGLTSGDLTLEVASTMALDSLIVSALRASGEVERQLLARNFNADSLQSAIPPMTLAARVGRANFVRAMALERGFDFRSIRADVESGRDRPFRIDAAALGLRSGALTLDTLDLKAVRNGDRLDYALRLANRPVTPTPLGLIRVRGDVGGNQLIANVLQRNSDGRTGFDFGLSASLRDSTVRVEMAPDPILGYERWRVGANNFEYPAAQFARPTSGAGDWLEVDLNGRLRGDLHLENSATKRNVAITTSSLPGISEGALRLFMRGLDLSPMLDLFPTLPRIGGLIGSDITVGLHKDGGNTIIAAKGGLEAKDFSYEGQRVADIDAAIDFGMAAGGRMVLDARMMLEKSAAMTAKGVYADEKIDFDVEIPSIPLSVAEGFLPAGMARLTGQMDGRLKVKGDPAKPAIVGDVGFTEGQIEALMLGTSFRISPERVAIADNRVTFKELGIIAPNNQKLTLNGTVNIADMAAMSADLAVSARNFRFVNSNHIGGSQIYGTGELSTDMTIKGLIDALRIRGNVDLTKTTNLVYIMRETSTLRDEKQNVVQFVRFADSIYVDDEDPLPIRAAARQGGMDVLLAIGIGDGLRATVSLDEVNENRIELIGGGDLSLGMNAQGDMRMSGRYTLSGGKLYYKPPVISQKVFAVQDGSYVEWRGAAMEPEFHVSATQRSTVKVDYEGGMSENVDFDLTAVISGSLRHIDMRFDLAAPTNLAIQNDLLAMTPEERMRHALGLMLQNQYSGPRANAKVMDIDARGQLNEFISKEINQWARNNLKGVDLSVGIKTKDGLDGARTTDYSYNFSQRLSNRATLSIGGRVSDDATSASFANNLFEDVILEYRLWGSRDNIFLKLYRYNTRPSLLEGQVSDMGAGLVVKKKINRFRDLLPGSWFKEKAK